MVSVAFSEELLRITLCELQWPRTTLKSRTDAAWAVCTFTRGTSENFDFEVRLRRDNVNYCNKYICRYLRRIPLSLLYLRLRVIMNSYRWASSMFKTNLCDLLHSSGDASHGYEVNIVNLVAGYVPEFFSVEGWSSERAAWLTVGFPTGGCNKCLLKFSQNNCIILPCNGFH